MFVDNVLLLYESNYPLVALAEQLTSWSQCVDDGSACHCFVFRTPAHPKLVGTFRIEPRPAGWQFTSSKELRRHERLLSLNEFKKMAAEFDKQLRPFSLSKD